MRAALAARRLGDAEFPLICARWPVARYGLRVLGILVACRKAAPPGCGKTEVLAYRAEHLIASLGPNQKILALTFTNRARANLRDRLRQVLGAERARRFVTVRNFHGHAAEVVLSHYRTLGLDLSAYVPPTTRTLAKALREVTTDNETARAAAALLGRSSGTPSATKRYSLPSTPVPAALAERPRSQSRRHGRTQSCSTTTTCSAMPSAS
jgi:hypothetical protein